MPFGQLRLRIEEIDLTRSARHVEKDHALCRAVEMGCSIEQPGKCHDADAAGSSFEELASRRHGVYSRVMNSSVLSSTLASPVHAATSTDDPVGVNAEGTIAWAES